MASIKKRVEAIEKAVVERAFSHDDLIRSIEEAIVQPTGEGLTTTEICEMLGESLPRVRSILHKFKKEGRLIVGKGLRETLDGRMIRYPVYSLRPKEEGESPPP